MRDIKKLGKSIINRDFYIKDLIDKDLNFKIILKHDDNKLAIIDFKKEVVDYRFSRKIYRKNYLASMNKYRDFWPVLLIKDSDYLKKISKEDSDVMLFVDKDICHYLIHDNDYVIDVIAGKDPDIYIKSGTKK